MQNHIDTITNFIVSQMDGESVPCHNSEAFIQLSKALDAIRDDASDKTFKMMGLKTLVAVLDRVKSNLGAEKTLLKFIAGGNHA